MTPTSFNRVLVRAGATCALLLTAGAAPAFAEHRARLSADLAEHLAAQTSTIDVIVHGDSAMVDTLARRYNLPVRRRLKSGAVLRVTAGQLDALQRDPDVDHLSGDVQIRSQMAITNVAIGADQVWAGDGLGAALGGNGVAVAVVDSGIDRRHAALKGRVLTAVDFTGGDGVDRFGHGTHVAGIIAAQAGGALDTRDVQGVAPGAYLVDLRVLGDDGSGTVSSVVDAIDWAIDHRKQYGIGVINLSLGGPVLQSYRDDPMCEAVERAVAAGLVVVAAAGNYGTNKAGQIVFGGVTSPGNDPLAITVGALDTHGTPQRSDDTVAPYSSRGPTQFDRVIKPDLVAPGTHIESLEVAGSYLSTLLPQRHVTGTGANAYIQLSGTSMAAAVVSGTAALLLQESHRVAPAGVKLVLQLTSSFLPRVGLLTEGAGSLNALAAVLWTSEGFRGTTDVTIVGEHVSATGISAASIRRAVFDQEQHPSAIGLNPGSTTWAATRSIIWGSASAKSIVWGTLNVDSIVWGSLDQDSIVWGSLSGDSIVWGASDSIVWGSFTQDSIIWGSWNVESIIWGSSNLEPTIWGTWDWDSIVWG